MITVDPYGSQWDVDALRALKRGKRRVLDVACPGHNRRRQQHRLLEVFKTDAGLVVTGTVPSYLVETHRDGGQIENPEFGGYTSWEHERESRKLLSREGALTVFIEHFDGARFQCKCSVREIHDQWLRRQLAPQHRHRRVIAD